tara:strand:- start:45099 stop:46589 length:1491 start_codon:yes stop_codon:yes gene_type:complete
MKKIIIEQNFVEFKKKYQENKTQIISSKIVNKKETIISAFLKVTEETDNSFLFESLEDGEEKGRYSIIGLNPDKILRIKDQKVTVEEFGIEKIRGEGNIISTIRNFINENIFEFSEKYPSIASGIFGYIGYDFIRNIEQLPNQNKDPLNLPDSILLRPSSIIVFDNKTNDIFLITFSRPDKGVSAEESMQIAESCLTDLFNKLEKDEVSEKLQKEQSLLEKPKSNTSKEEYFEMVKKARDYIIAGDIFQVVPSQRFFSPFKISPFELYKSLRNINPSPYMYYLDLKDFYIVGSSPETLVKKEKRKITIKPIAGTRLKREGSNRELAKELLSDPKERAEHLMLLDLGRNDVGKVSKIGTVNVKNPFSIQETSHLLHIASTVEGELKDSDDEISSLSAGFPAGTVSGAPKIRAMEIIDELEKEKRGIYAGAIGYFSSNGDMDTAIALRTAIIKDEIMYVQAGGGVVYDSDEEYEYNETVNKSQALFSAAKDAIERNIK